MYLCISKEILMKFDIVKVKKTLNNSVEADGRIDTCREGSLFKDIERKLGIVKVKKTLNISVESDIY